MSYLYPFRLTPKRRIWNGDDCMGEDETNVLKAQEDPFIQQIDKRLCVAEIPLCQYSKLYRYRTRI